MTIPRNWLISCLLCLALAQTTLALAGRFNISFAQLDTCDSLQIDSSNGYAYKEFFKIHTLDNNKIKSNEHLHLKFYVLTNMDAHILLSVTNHPRHRDRVYEIVIGAGGNTFSAIRTIMGDYRVSTNQDPNLLSVYEPTPIEIVQTKDGVLSIFVPGFKKEAILHYTDPSPLTINYISFSTFGSSSARWFYDCSFDGYTNEMEQEERKQTVSDLLLDWIIDKAQNRTLPSNLNEIKFYFKMHSLAYDESKSQLHTRMQLVLHWNDPRLHWLPENYNNMTSFVHPYLKIWLPQIIALNSDLNQFGDVLLNYEVRVYSNGNISVMAKDLELSTWCVDTARNWPNERIDCNIQLGVEENAGRIALTADGDQSPLAPNEHVNTPSGWTFVKVECLHVDNSTNLRYTTDGTIQTIAGDVFIGFTIQRNSAFYRHVFVMPLIACQIFIILSFLLRGYRRGALILIVVVLTAWGLMFLTRHASPNYVPPLMSAYGYIMWISIYCYMLHIAIMWLERYPPREKPAHYIMAIINSNWLRMVLGLRLTEAMDYCGIQEQPWRQLAKMLNNLSFIVINICFIVLDVIRIA